MSITAPCEDTTPLLLLGDCLSKMQEIQDQSIDLILTDPPYTSPTFHAKGRVKVHRLSDLSIQEFYFTEIKKEWTRILKPNAGVLVFCDDIYSAVLMGLFYDWAQKNFIVWDKGRIGMGNPFRKQHELVFYANRGPLELNKENLTHISTIQRHTISKQHHGSEKPVSLLTTFIEGLTTRGGVVLDCFMGSGSTGVACMNTQRQFIGIELDPDYFEVAKKRLNID